MPVIGPDDFPPVPVPGAKCTWTVDTSCCPTWDAYDPAVQESYVAWATHLLDRLTGYQFGQCPVTVRPCNQPCPGFGGYLTWPVGDPSSNGSGAPWMIPFVDSGIWRNCGCTGGCTCRARCELVLGQFPVFEVGEVTIDGLTLDPSAYRLDKTERGPVLIRTDGDCWPECQDMNVAADQVGAFTVTYTPGRVVPPDGAIAAGMLACQFAKACTGAGDCALPSQLQSLTREGVQVELIDPNTLPESVLTGVADVDRWVRSVNPANLRTRPRVLSPDLRPHRVVS